MLKRKRDSEAYTFVMRVREGQQRRLDEFAERIRARQRSKRVVRTVALARTAASASSDAIAGAEKGDEVERQWSAGDIRRCLTQKRHWKM